MINQRRLRIGSRLQKALQRKSSRRRIVRYGLISANVLILAAVVVFVVGGSRSNDHLSSANAAAKTDTSNPVDGLTSYDIAANVARVAGLPESNAVDNQAQSARAAVAVTASDSTVVAKPQIVATALKSRSDIQTYVALAGDTISSIAQKFGITSDSIRWSNNLTGDAIALGTKIVIPPVNGIVYTVKTGDTVQTLADKYKADANQITAYNDAEISGITVGEQILIPNGQIQAVTTTRTSSSLSTGSFTAIYGSSTGSSCAKWVGRYPCLYGNNGYDYGWCTWYVASRVSMPSNWGDARTWGYYAGQSGWTVSKTPQVGAIVQTSRGDHVGYVEQVSADGSQIIYSDMNGLAGWGNVGVSGWTSASLFEGHYSDVLYIYH
jgi:surface antigen